MSKSEMILIVTTNILINKNIVGYQNVTFGFERYRVILFCKFHDNENNKLNGIATQ